MVSKKRLLPLFSKSPKWLRAALAGLITFGILVFFAQSGGISSAAPGADVGAYLNPAWTTGILSDGVGPQGVLVADLNLDSVTDTLACISEGHAYDLVKYADGYETRWFSEGLKCSQIALGDRNGDGHKEVYLGTTDSTVYIFSGDDFAQLGKLTLPGSGEVQDLGVANVDGDAQVELVVVREDATFVYDATSLSQEWAATGKGGKDLGIGNIDGDAKIELVVNANPAHILDASSQTQKWAYSGGFGLHMAMGNLDGDAYDEIAYVTSGSAAVFDADSSTVKWHYDHYELAAIAVADADGDTVPEVIIGDGQWGDVHGHSGLDGTQIWRIGNPEHSVSGIGVGDTDNDSVNEVVWGAGLTSSGRDALFFGNWDTETVEWQTPDLDVPLLLASGDVDNDGQIELVMASNQTDSNYQGGTIAVYDAATHHLEWSALAGASFWRINQLAVGQVDADPQLEIIIAGENWYDSRVNAFDGISHASQWQSAALADGPTRGLLVANVDGDAVQEILVGLAGNKINVFNGATDVLQWESDALDGYIQDLALGDVDGDANTELAVLTSAGIYTFQSPGFAQEEHQAIVNGRTVAVANSDLAGAGELLITVTGDNGNSTLQKWSGSPLSGNWTKALGNAVVKDIAVGDLDSDGTQEFILGGLKGDQYDFLAVSYLLVGSQINGGFVIESNRGSTYGAIQNIALGDVGDGGAVEVLTGNFASIQVNTVTTGPFEQPTPTPTSVIPTGVAPTATPLPNKVKKVFFDNFEGSFPAKNWQITEEGWEVSNCAKYSGNYSAWAIKSTGTNCGDNYPVSQVNWMVHGPFSLKKAKLADVYFHIWLNAEEGKDSLFVGASTTGKKFYGVSYTGTTNTTLAQESEWDAETQAFTDGEIVQVPPLLREGVADIGWATARFDLTKVYKIDNLAGKTKVWIAFIWRSDDQNTKPNGVFVDDVLITKVMKKK